MLLPEKGGTHAMRKLWTVTVVLALLFPACSAMAAGGDVMLVGKGQKVKELHRGQIRLAALVAAGVDPMNIPPGLELEPNALEQALRAQFLLVLGPVLPTPAWEADRDNAVEQIKASTIPGLIYTDPALPAAVCTDLHACELAGNAVCGLDNREAGAASVIRAGCSFTCKDGAGTLYPLRGSVACTP